MNTARPWLTHGVGFDTEPAAGTAPPAVPPAAGAGAAPKTLADVLAAHPHLASELDTRTASIAAKEKDQGKRFGLAEWAKELGVPDGNPDVVADAFRKYTLQQTAQMTEAEKARTEAEALRTQAEAALREAKQAKFDAAAIKWLSLANCEDPAILAPTLLALGVTVDSTDEEIKAAVAELVKRTPGAFTGKAGGTPGAGNPGGPPAGAPGGTGNGREGSVEAELKSQLERVATRHRGRIR